MSTFDNLTIEPDQDAAGCWLCGHGEYEDSSVLAGQYRFARLGHYPTPDAARVAASAEYPGVPVEEIEHTTGPTARVPDCAPAGFSPADAGEAWSEEDY